ncbi:hypothetical protein G7046_g8149 [Stylonectria norvegica]|nr:hypothetical protein G7046_g8149 [Stylonectria norvegica]
MGELRIRARSHLTVEVERLQFPEENTSDEWALTDILLRSAAAGEVARPSFTLGIHGNKRPRLLRIISMTSTRTPTGGARATHASVGGGRLRGPQEASPNARPRQTGKQSGLGTGLCRGSLRTSTGFWSFARACAAARRTRMDAAPAAGRQRQDSSAGQQRQQATDVTSLKSAGDGRLEMPHITSKLLATRGYGPFAAADDFGFLPSYIVHSIPASSASSAALVLMLMLMLVLAGFRRLAWSSGGRRDAGLDPDSWLSSTFSLPWIHGSLSSRICRPSRAWGALSFWASGAGVEWKSCSHACVYSVLMLADATDILRHFAWRRDQVDRISWDASPLESYLHEGATRQIPSVYSTYSRTAVKIGGGDGARCSSMDVMSDIHLMEVASFDRVTGVEVSFSRPSTRQAAKLPRYGWILGLSITNYGPDFATHTGRAPSSPDFLIGGVHRARDNLATLNPISTEMQRTEGRKVALESRLESHCICIAVAGCISSTAAIQRSMEVSKFPSRTGVEVTDDHESISWIYFGGTAPAEKYPLGLFSSPFALLTTSTSTKWRRTSALDHALDAPRVLYMYVLPQDPSDQSQGPGRRFNTVSGTFASREGAVAAPARGTEFQRL